MCELLASSELRLRPGDFVHPDVVLLAVVGTELDPRLADRLRGCLSLGAMRSPSRRASACSRRPLHQSPLVDP